MSHVIEYRKVNDTYVPLYFKFSTVSTKYNLTSNKYMSLEHWMYISDELDPLIGSDPSSAKKNKSFDIDSGRLTVKTKWVKISDSDMGGQILKILDLSSTNVGKYFLKIDVKLNSYFQRMLTESESKNRPRDVKNKSKELNQSVHTASASKHKKYTDRKISEMLPKIEKEKNDSSSLFNEAILCNGFSDLNAEESTTVEEYVPEAPAPLASSSFLANETPVYNPTEKTTAQIETNPIRSEYSPTFVKPEKSIEDIDLYDPVAELTNSIDFKSEYSPNYVNAGLPLKDYVPSTDSTPVYSPEKNLARIEINQSKSEYSPNYVNADKSLEEVMYKPTIKITKSQETEKSKKLSDKKSRELFGSSDENNDDNILEKVSSSSSHRSKRKNESSRDKKSSKERSKSKKKKLHNVQNSQDSNIGDISIRNLMNESIGDILATYPEHEEYLTELYGKHYKQLKRSYRPIDIPDMAALDIVSSPQFTAMIGYLEQKLVRDAEEEHNYSDVIFDLLIPEWALGIFCKKFECTRPVALERLRMQSLAMSNNDSQLLC